MKLSSLIFACWAIIIAHGTSGDLIPGKIQAPRVKRESIRHVRSPTALDQSKTEYPGMDGDESDVMKKFYEDVFGAFEELKIVEGSEDETSASRVAISRPAILEWYRGTPVSREDTAKALKEIAAKPSSSKVISRRRQQTKSLTEGRQASRASSGTARQPIKRSTAPRNLPGT